MLLEDMLEAASKIKRFCTGLNFSDFLNDDKTVDAVIRNFEVIGEAATRVVPDFKLEHQEIEWNKLKGFRNRLIHEYFGIDHEIVWDIILQDIDPLADFLNNILNES